MGIKTLSTLSNGQKIANLDTTAEDRKIKKYYRRLSKKKYRSNRYNKTLKTLGKWITKKQNKLNDTYHKLSNYIVKNYDIICMEDLDIKELFEEKKFSSFLQTIGWRKLINMIKYKCQWYGKIFIQINRWYPSSKICSNCGYYNKDLKNEKEWTYPHCQKTHDRDINAAKNIHKQCLIDLINEKMNLWSRGIAQ